MLNLIFGTVATLIAFTGFVVAPNLIINTPIGDKIPMGVVFGFTCFVAVIGDIFLAMFTNNVAWVWGLLAGFFLMLGLGLVLARIANATYPKHNDEEDDNE